MVNINGDRVTITVNDETVKTLLVFKDGEFSQTLPIPNNQNYAELSCLPAGDYIVHQFDSLGCYVTEDEFTITD